MREHASPTIFAAKARAERGRRGTGSRARGCDPVATSPFGLDARARRRRRTKLEPSLPLRMLLTTDGSVTALLEASFRTRVAVETRSNDVDSGRLVRSAVLSRESDGHPLLRATSEIDLDSLPTRARRALVAGDQPIGTVLRDAQLETRRELGSYSVDAATAEDAADLGVVPCTAIFERTYRIVKGAQPLATITERIPASLFDDAI